MTYIDTIVIVADYCPEALSMQIQNLLRKQLEKPVSTVFQN
ncbi:MAG: hypothetical protein ABR542_11130 [Desulfonatronovibrio sp.]